MGQYHIAVNLDRREFIFPHKLGDGLKLMEQVMNGPGGIGSALILLLAVSNGETGRGGGDFHPEGFTDVVGRWGGDRIAIVGDYAEKGDLPADNPEIIYSLCDDEEGFAAQLAHWRNLAQEARESDTGTLYGKTAAEWEGLAALAEAQGPYTDITDRVVEALSAEGYLRYSGTGWRNRNLSWDEETV